MATKLKIGCVLLIGGSALGACGGTVDDLSDAGRPADEGWDGETTSGGTSSDGSFPGTGGSGGYPGFVGVPLYGTGGYPGFVGLPFQGTGGQVGTMDPENQGGLGGADP